MKKLLVVCAAMALLAASAVKADPVKLKFAFFTGETERTWTTTIKPFIDAINKEGKGIIEIEAYPNGALGRNMAQQAQMVLDGVADIAFARTSAISTPPARSIRRIRRWRCTTPA